MPSSPENAAALTNPPPISIGYLYQHQRNRSRAVDNNLQVRGRNISKYEFGRKDRYGERVTRIYPRQTKSPQNIVRYPASPNPATSPILQAFGTTTTTAAHYTSEWTKSLPFFAGQPPHSNGRSVSGSPGQNFGISNSPPSLGGRPMSHPNHYPSFGGRLQGSPQQSPPRDRRASMFSHHNQQPPLPHQPQSHYYGLPDIDFGLDAPQSELAPGSNGYFCGFDSLDAAGDKPSLRVGQNALLVGYEGGLDVFDVGAQHMNVLGRVEGLRGSVIGAKVLPWGRGSDPCAEDRPLVALIVHGPVVDGIKDARHSSGSSSGGGTDENDGSSSPPTRPASVAGDTLIADVTHYQTTVEVWSLKKGQHIATLYRVPPVPCSSSLQSPMFRPPPPSGDLRIDANGKFVVVASGCSGEVFLFTPKKDEAQPEAFRCIGKVWTTVQIRDHTPVSSTSSSTEINSLEVESPTQYGYPLFSLSERWIAVVPPASSNLYSLNSTPLLSPTYPKPPGITTHAPPPPPSPNCQVDAPEDGFFKNASREMAQQAMKGMQWAASTGMQAWKNYWNKPTLDQGPNEIIQTDSQGQPYFPPTHGHNHNSVQAANEPSVVSIFDLQKLADAETSRNRSALQPLTSFAAPLGCSFLSFSPSGLMLMTFSKKGDNQFVWDLNCMHHTSSRSTRGNRSAQSHVRQVAKFTRMTVANIIDVAWSAPSARRLAILTDKGTVHMYPMPASAFQWPPPRRARKPDPPKPAETVSENVSAKGAGIIGSAAQNITGKAKPFFTSVRSRSASGGSGFSLSGFAMTPAAGAKGGKAVAAGIGKSIGGAASNLKHAGDNKLQLPSLANGVSSSSVRWLYSHKHRDPRIALVAGGLLAIYKVRFEEVRSKNGRPQTRITKHKVVEYSLPTIRDTRIAPSVLAYINSRPGEESAPFPGTEKTQESYWVPRAPLVRREQSRKLVVHPLATAEIETNTPYQPFHTDRRIDLFVNNVTAANEHHHHQAEDGGEGVPIEPPSFTAAAELHHYDDAGPWVFGAEIPALKVSLPSSHASDVDDGLADDLLALEMGGEGRPVGGGAAGGGMVSDFALREGEEEVEQVVVTTRRRRLRRNAADDAAGAGDGAASPDVEEGFFEDDCEVWDFAGDRV
ncbi:uncharacterized protein IWZ02DRAFT_444791 [Phyllosticta citriasiana]|uniref:uncharacterized protein n=1 Tax=Phyllosticta citriasiana TaxID=595635 RepID=UPI0030FD2A63